MMKTSITIDRRKLAERRVIVDRRKSVESIRLKEAEQHKKISVVYEAAGLTLAVFLCVVVLKMTGLFDSLETTTGKIGVTIAISCIYAGLFRHGLNSR